MSTTMAAAAEVLFKSATGEEPFVADLLLIKAGDCSCSLHEYWLFAIVDGCFESKSMLRGVEHKINYGRSFKSLCY